MQIKRGKPLPEEVGLEEELYGSCPEGQMIALLIIHEALMSNHKIPMTKADKIIEEHYGISRSQMRSYRAFKKIQTPETTAGYKAGEYSIKTALRLSTVGTGEQECRVCKKIKDLGEFDYDYKICIDCYRPIKEGNRQKRAPEKKIERSGKKKKVISANEVIKKHNAKRVLSRNEEAVKLVSGLNFMLEREGVQLREMIPTLTPEELIALIQTFTSAWETCLHMFLDLSNGLREVTEYGKEEEKESTSKKPCEERCIPCDV